MGTAIEYCMVCGNPNCSLHTWTGMLPTRFSRPHTCPNCNGYGNEAKMYYHLVPTAMVCRSCGGSGIAWG